MKNDFNPSGYIALSFFHGFAVEISDDGDACRARDEKADGRPSGRARWQRIIFNNAGDPYLIHHGRRYSFDNIQEFIKPVAQTGRAFLPEFSNK